MRASSAGDNAENSVIVGSGSPAPVPVAGGEVQGAVRAHGHVELAVGAEAQPASKEARRHWARLIKKVYEVDPLRCPQCSGRMRMISFIEDSAVIQKILTPLGLWHVPPRKRAPPSPSDITFDDSVADEPAAYD